MSEDVETKPSSRKSREAGAKPSTLKPNKTTTPKVAKRQAPTRTPKAERAALDETHLTLETDSAPRTPGVSRRSAELLAELESHRVAAGEMARRDGREGTTIAALERELRAAFEKPPRSRRSPGRRRTASPPGSQRLRRRWGRNAPPPRRPGRRWRASARRPPRRLGDSETRRLR